MSVGSLQDILAIERSRVEPFAALTNTYDMIGAGAAIDPDAPALSFVLQAQHHTTPATWSYREWHAEVTRTANMLRRLGLKKDEVVAYVLPNLPETHLAVWGGETAGIAFAVNTLLEGEQMGKLLQAADTRWLITLGPSPDPEVWNRVREALRSRHDSGMKLQGILAVNALRHTPGSPAGSGTPEPVPGLPSALEGVPVYDFHFELARESGEALDFAAPAAEDTASYFCTGGTTGLPKIAVHTHRNETSNATQLAAVIPDLFRPGKTLLTCLPLFHVNAQLGTGLAVFATGGHVLLGPPAGYRSPGLMENFWHLVAHHRVASFSGVPTVFAALLQASMEGLDLSCLDYAICGAAPLPVELLNSFERKTGMRLLEGYGLTESSCAATLTPPRGASQAGSIGLRLPWEEIRSVILDDDGRYLRDAEIDEVGVIALRGPNVFAGYLSEEHNASAWIEVPGDDRPWLNTGDLARQDAEGFFWLTGRKKELIIRGGHNIDPKVIEETLAAHPSVAICAAVGRPDAHSGEVPVVYVQLQQEGSVSEAELMAHAQAHIPERAAVPKAIHIVDALPTTAVGKTFKPALVMREIEGVVREEAEAAGLSLAEVTVIQDPGRGMVVSYRPESGDAASLAARLGHFTFHSVNLTDG